MVQMRDDILVHLCPFWENLLPMLRELRTPFALYLFNHGSVTESVLYRCVTDQPFVYIIHTRQQHFVIFVHFTKLQIKFHKILYILIHLMNFRLCTIMNILHFWTFLFTKFQSVQLHEPPSSLRHLDSFLLLKQRQKQFYMATKN